MLCIGTDVHAKLLTSYAVPLDMEDVEEKEFCDEFNREFKSTPADRQTMLRLAKWLQGWEHCILIENSTKTHEVYWTLTNEDANVLVANAAQLYAITKSVRKTDHHDSYQLAHYMRRYALGEREFAECLMVDSVQMNRRQICRIYALESENLSNIRRRIRSYMLLRGITVEKAYADIVAEFNLKELEMTADSSMRFLIDDARHQREKLASIRKSIAKEFDKDETYKLIMSIPGFGVVTSAYLASMIVSVDRFTSPAAFAAYFGVVPKQRESAEHAEKCGITRRGDEIALDMLRKGTFAHISQDKDRTSSVSMMYDRLRKRGFPHKKALTACSNKMAHIMYAILKSGECYRP